MRNTISVSFFCIVSLFANARARADVPPADAEPCMGKAAGAACTYGTAGTCQEQTCTKADLAHWDHDASAAPPTTSYACIKCVPGSTTATGTHSNTDTSTPSSTATGTQTGTDTSTSSDGGFCSVGRSSTMGRLAPWLMAAVFSLLFLLGRRRPQK
jgi:hypothetical protein